MTESEREDEKVFNVAWWEDISNHIVTKYAKSVSEQEKESLETAIEAALSTVYDRGRWYGSGDE